MERHICDRGKPLRSLCPLCEDQTLFDSDAEVSSRIFDLRMIHEDLDCAKIIRSLVDHRRLGPAAQMRAILGA